MKWREQILDLQAYQPGKTVDEIKKQYGLTSLTKLASNENPYGYSPKVDEALKNFAETFALYPDGYATNIRETIATFLNVPEKQLIFGNGTDEILLIISRALLEPGKNTVMPTPTFSQYKHNAIVEGAEIREIPLVNGTHDLDGMLHAIDENTSVVWICSPNNPTGIHIPSDELEAFLDKVPENVLVVIDEAYCEYVTASNYHDSQALLNKYANIIITRTFSKIYGLASFRVGYGVASEEVIALLEPVRQPFNVNVLGQLVASAAIEDQDFVRLCKQQNKEQLEVYYEFCKANDLEFYPSETNFILIDFKQDGNEIFQQLLKKGFIVRSGVPLGFPTSVRITIGTPEQNKGVLSALESILAERNHIRS